MPTALITGATTGIGAAFARRLARDGFDLILVARDEARLQAAAAELHSVHNVEVEVLVADLSTDKGIATAEEAAKRADLLVNNAGFAQRGRFRTTPVIDEVAMIRVHCEAVLRLTHAALSTMTESANGGIINVSSIAAYFPGGTYSASKAWVLSFTRGIKQEAPNIPITVLCPGYVRTELHERAEMDVSHIPPGLWMDADRLVSDALRDLRRGVLVSIPGVRYKLIAHLGKYFPRRLSGPRQGK